MAREYLKYMMADALKNLVRKKAIQKVTVSDIVNECGLSKQTFYNYFKDKNDLILYTCILEGRKSVRTVLDAGLDYKDSIVEYYKNSLPLKYFYRSFIYEPAWKILLQDCVLQSSVYFMKCQIEYRYGTAVFTPELNLAIRFNAAGNAQLFVDWVAENMATPPEVMADVNCACVPDPLKSYFNCKDISTNI